MTTQTSTWTAYPSPSHTSGSWSSSIPVVPVSQSSPVSPAIASTPVPTSQGSCPSAGAVCHCPVVPVLGTVTVTKTIYSSMQAQPTTTIPAGPQTTETVTVTLGNGMTTCITMTYPTGPTPVGPSNGGHGGHGSWSQPWYPVSGSTTSSGPAPSGTGVSSKPSGAWGTGSKTSSMPTGYLFDCEQLKLEHLVFYLYFDQASYLFQCEHFLQSYSIVHQRLKLDRELVG
ncbi:hypothetical protein LTR78_007323 [Recurvomyces mirabilis]|uniref:Uncharacterized protein n=1 Tax=Recurvomyces mirabilis TaxID=574656 RepID=A0AAE0TT67_9PEZI|nr:hypothetical protein LTR78_007323 [Recurvomyces mirabilis]KAK5155088.1 hypothetical protein LTS14_006043 [Recurvomyces mirabilis]